MQILAKTCKSKSWSRLGGSRKHPKVMTKLKTGLVMLELLLLNKQFVGRVDSYRTHDYKLIGSCFDTHYLLFTFNNNEYLASKNSISTKSVEDRKEPKCGINIIIGFGSFLMFYQ